MRAVIRLVLTATILLAATGCTLVPPIVFPKTSVHGRVVDTDGVPMTNVLIETESYPPRLLPGTEPMVPHHTRSGKDGRWSYTEHKVGNLYIEAIPPSGYEAARNPTNRKYLTTIGPFNDGDCPTNDFILILKKLPADPNQK